MIAALRVAVVALAVAVVALAAFMLAAGVPAAVLLVLGTLAAGVGLLAAASIPDDPRPRRVDPLSREALFRAMDRSTR